MQALICTASSGSFSLSLNGVQSSIISTNATLSQLVSALSVITNVTVTRTGSTSYVPSAPVCDPTGYHSVFIQFEEIRGEVVALRPTASGGAIGKVQVYTDEGHGAISGIFPLWGTFSLGFKGETTTEVSFDASASEVESAVEALYAIGEVQVLKDTYGVAYGPDGKTPFYQGDSSLFSVWTVLFNAVCSGNQYGKSSGKCPSSLGQEPLFSPNLMNIKQVKSPYYQQDSPEISVTEIVKGYGGNNITNYNDVALVSILLQNRGIPSAPAITLNAIQGISCSGTSGNFTVQFLNDTVVTLEATLTPRQVQDYLQKSLPPGFIVNVSSNSSVLCSPLTPLTLISFTQPNYTLPTMIVLDVFSNSSTLKVRIIPIVNAVDSVSIVPSTLGLFQINYTPTFEGIYDVDVFIGNRPVSNDLVNGVVVVPAAEYALTSTHNVSQVNEQGFLQYFTIQFRDRFANKLQGPISPSSLILLSMIGTKDVSQADNSTGSEVVEIPVSVLDREPYTDGVYTVTYEPTFAGSYTLSAKLLTVGGLLGTYYRRVDLEDPVLASWGNVHDGLYHDPYWCDGAVIGQLFTGWNYKELQSVSFCDPTISTCGCDSTRLDTSIAFNWGYDSALPYDDLFQGGFPSDFFSVKWTGYVTSPGSGESCLRSTEPRHLNILI